MRLMWQRIATSSFHCAVQSLFVTSSHGLAVFNHESGPNFTPVPGDSQGMDMPYASPGSLEIAKSNTNRKVQVVTLIPKCSPFWRVGDR